jgi:L-ascorbate metabolism protein UlaG (beta-lactamase superfamily)
MTGSFEPERVGRAIEEARRGYDGRNWPASFADRLTAPLPGYRDLIRIMREGGFGVRDLSDAARIPVRHQGLPRVAADQAAVTWVGHATFVVQLGGRTIVTDPVWSRRIPGVKPRLTPPGVDWADLPHVDAVLISHNHYDHLDGPTIRRLPKDTPIFAPGMLGWWLRRRGFRDVTELDWWESADRDGVGYGFVPAHHWSRRTLRDTCKSLWGGWVLSTDTAKIYFAGDTGYGHWFGEIAAHHPGLDLALLPVGAYEPNWFMKPVHMNPAEAVRACADLVAPRMATMHWGTFVLSAEPLLDPWHRTVGAWTAAGRPRDDLWDLAVGESRTLPPRT